MRIGIHYFGDGLMPLIRSFTRNFQASVDSYVADALDCKQKGRYIVQGASGTANASTNLHNPNDKIKYLLKDILGLEFFQSFLERKRNGMFVYIGISLCLSSICCVCVC